MMRSARRIAHTRSEDASAFQDDPTSLVRTPGFHGALHRPSMPVGELLPAGGLQPGQQRNGRQRGLAVEPGMDLLLEGIKHRRSLRHWLAATIRTPVCGAPLAFPPRRLQAGGEAFGIDDDRLGRRRLRAATRLPSSARAARTSESSSTGSARAYSTCPRGSTATPRASLRQARQGHCAMQGPLYGLVDELLSFTRKKKFATDESM
jgi:hypothetical protein